jgi:hypothetical protein
MIRSSGMLFSALYVVFGCVQAQTSGQVSGVVLDGKKGVAKARVQAVLVVDPRRGAANPAVFTQTDAAGTFQFTDLSQGSYRICVDVPDGDLLDPCDWSESPVTLDVKADQTVTGIQVKLERGVWVEVRIDDDKRTFRAVEAPGTGATVLVGVYGPDEQYLPAREVREDGQGRTYRMLVPDDTPVRVFTRGLQVTLTDDVGDDIPVTGHGVPVRTRAVDARKTVHYRVRAAH